LQKVSGSGYLRALGQILKRFPNHFHIFAGAGDVKAIRTYLHSESVLERVRFLGQVGDPAPLFAMIDVYLDSFPRSGSRSILEVMGAGKPAVVMRLPPDSHCDSGTQLMGMTEMTAKTEAQYVEIADTLLRNSQLRTKCGRAMLDRFHAEFHPNRLGERYRAFIDSL
jgi:predicted O-linked N-acetylglucosamine transferase (SPINDLY family)